MEENKEQEELNNLRREGRINVDDIKKESTFSEKSIKPDSIEQIIDEDSLLEAANQNSIYSNMIEPCSMEGINITKRLRKYFEENKVKPEDLVEEIRRQMSIIRKDINQHTQNLFFDESGNINIELSIEKARRNGVKLPNYIRAIDEEISNDAIEEDKRKPFLINGVDVYKQIEDKPEEFWKNLQKDIEDKFKKLDEEHNIEEAVSKIDEQKSDKNKEFKAGLQTISNLARNIPIVKDRKENRKNLLKVLYLYQESNQLNLNEVDGLLEEDKKKLAESIEELKKILKYRFTETSSLDIESVNFKELAESLNFSEKEIKELLEEFKNEFKKEFSKQIENDKSYNELSEENKAELEKRDLIRVIKLYKTFEELPSSIETYEKVKEFYPNINQEALTTRLKRGIEKKHPGLMEEADKEYEQDSLMPIFAEIIKRNYLFKRFSEFKKVEDNSDRENLLKEYTTIISAIEFISREDVYGNVGEKFQEDIECNNQAFKVIKDVFPEVVVQESKIDMQKLLLQFKERYGFDQRIKKINDIDSFVDYVKIRTDLKMRGAIANSLYYKNEEEIKSVTEILKDKEILEEVQRKDQIQKKLVIKEKKFSILEGELEFLLQKSNLTLEEEHDLVKYLCIVAKEYSEETDKEKYLLYDIAKTKLSRYLPGAFDEKNIFHLEKVDEEFQKYMQNNGNPIDNPSKFLEEESKKVNDVAERQYLADDLKRNPKALAEKETAINMERMSVFDQTQKQEKLLKFVEFVRRANNTGKINLANANEFLDKIDGKVKANLESIFSNRENPKEETEKYLNKVKIDSTDNDFLESMIRNVRREYANKNQIIMLRKYAKENRITDEDDKKQILTMYLGTKNDTRNSILNNEKNNIRHKSFSMFFEKISPELVQKNEINEEALLNFYNNTFGTDFKDIEEVYKLEENKLLGEVVKEVADDVIESKKRYYDPRTMAGIIASNTLEIHNNIQAEALRKISDLSWEKAGMSVEEIDASSLEMDTFTHERVHATSDEYDKEEFSSPIEEVNEIRVEEIKVSTQDIPSQDVPSQNISSQEELNTDNHPVLLKKSNLFTKTFEILGRFIKERINNFRNGSSINNDRNPEVVPIKTIDSDEKIKRLTGYGKQEIDFSRISLSKTEEQSKIISIEEKRNSGSEVGDK